MLQRDLQLAAFNFESSNAYNIGARCPRNKRNKYLNNVNEHLYDTSLRFCNLGPHNKRSTGTCNWLLLISNLQMVTTLEIVAIETNGTQI